MGGAAGVSTAGSGGVRNVCDPWPMTQGCLTVEQIEMLRAAAAGASAGVGGAGQGARPIFPQAGFGGFGTAGDGGSGAGGVTTSGGASGTAGTESAGSPGIDGSGGAADPPLVPSDCPSLPRNSRLMPCVDGISGPPTHVQGGMCCWTCRMVCG
jgi:hypothetical protein